jgi:hypothetical protein
MPTEPRPPSASEIWQRLVDEAGDEEVERAASVSVEQAERELAAMGVDVAAQRAKADDFLQALERGAVAGPEGDRPQPDRSSVRTRPDPKPARGERRHVPGRVVLLAAAATAAVGGAIAYGAAHHRHPAPAPSPAPSPSPDIANADELRRYASKACEHHDWATCLMLLDQAREKDPAGDSRPEVVRLREQVSAASREIDDGKKNLK